MQRVKKYLRSCFSGNVRIYLLDYDCGRLPTNMRMKFHVKIILAAKKSAFACSAFSKKYNFSHNKSLFPQPKYSVELMAATTISEETCCTTCSTKGTKQKISSKQKIV